MTLPSRFLFAVVLIAVLIGGRQASAQVADVITNGGFESGFTAWNPDATLSLVEDASTAHSGSNCITAEVTLPNRAVFLRRNIPVKEANRYRLVLWAKATGGTKLVIRVKQPGTDPSLPIAQANEMVANFENIPRQWRRYTCDITARQDGQMELNVIGPSSHGTPVGRMWIDDIVLYEQVMPPLVSVTGNEEFNDEGTMAIAADGSAYVAWSSFRDEADSLQVARYTVGEKSMSRQDAWQVLAGGGTYLLDVQAVSAGDKVVVLYAAEQSGNWDIYAVSCGPNGPGTPIAITNDAAADVDPVGVWHDGTLWIAWESNGSGSRRIMATSMRDGKIAPPVAVSSDGCSNYDPSIAVLESGEVAVAWHSFRENNFDLFLRRYKADNTWSAEQRLTHAPTIDRHVELLTRGDELWMVYENATMGTTDVERGNNRKDYQIGSTLPRQIITAKITAEGLMAPKDYFVTSPLAKRTEAATARFDAMGRLWVAYRAPRLPREGWDVFATCFDGKNWTTPISLCAKKGLDRRPSMAIVDRQAVVAFQADDNPSTWVSIEASAQATSQIFLAMADLGTLGQVTSMELEPLVEPTALFSPGTVRVARGEDMATPSIDYQGEKLNLYFGDLHDHTDISICAKLADESVDESYQNMRDIVRHDFACVTDHGYNLNPYLWNYTAKMARVNEDPGRFLTFLAEEWTSTFKEYDEKHPYGFYGHRNLIFADTYFPRWWNARNRQTPAQVWEDLRKQNANFVHIPHQLADTGNVPTDWDFADEEAQPVAEIFQGRGSYEFKGTIREAARTTPGPGSFIQDAWARGIVIGVIASPDHTGGYGKACVYAPELTREAILDAIRARHCYGTTAAKIVLDVRVNGHLMGEAVSEPAGDTAEVEIFVRCPAEIDRIEVCRDNQFIYATSPEGLEAKLTFIDRDPPAGRAYYYVRVIQKDEEIAWSSPVWFGAEQE